MDTGDELAEIFSISEDLVKSPSHKSAGTLSIDFNGLLETPLLLDEDLKEGCGGQLWPAGVVLSKYMLRKHKTSMKGKSILELGAGGGLVGLAVAMGCQIDQPVMITDQKPMLALMQSNIALNELENRARAEVYDWGEPRPDAIIQHPDIVLAADCVYFEPAFPPLQKTLADLIGEKTVCYFCFQKRRKADVQFMKTAKKLFEVTEVNDNPDKDVYGRESLFLYEIRKKSCGG